ncbi:hypothetical protein [Actinomadura graeca]|uniref:hypothetical protein n=1 Tax=Actinomadura graeca TaxID=2750812 RepID=UPI001E369872|nr:hypothetical protein [Actinomadura graeca]
MRTVPLFLAYYFVLTPYGLARRVIRDPLARRPDRRAASYWTFTAPARSSGTANDPGRV